VGCHRFAVRGLLEDLILDETGKVVNSVDWRLPHGVHFDIPPITPVLVEVARILKARTAQGIGEGPDEPVSGCRATR